MTAASEDFVTNFHNLKGTTIGERRKNLFVLLNQTQTAPNLSELKPRTPLEEIFRIEVFLHFQKFSDLFENLKNENSIIIERILKDLRFINYISENVCGPELMNLFSNISYNTKLKLMNKLSLHMDNVKRGDEYFIAVKDRYGLYLASKLLPACSLEVVLAQLSKYRIEVTPRYLLTLIRKYPTSTEEIIEKLHQQSPHVNISEKYNYVFRYLIINEPCLFLKVMEKFKPKFRLGTRATSTFLREQRQSVLVEPHKFYFLLKKNCIGLQLREDFSKFYTQLLPKSIQDFKSNFDEYLALLKHIPSKHERLNVLLKAFSTVYCSELWEYDSLISPELIEMMNSDARIEWMQTHQQPSSITELTWISFLKTEESIPKLKELISYTSNIKVRAAMIAVLVRTCIVNNDKSALLSVLQYILEKHQNDHKIVHEKYMQLLSTPKYLSLFGREHWDILHKILRLPKLQSGFSYCISSIRKTYVYFCLDNNLPIKPLLVELAKDDYCVYNICTKNPSYEKLCLTMFLEILPTLYDGKKLESMYLSYIHSLINWNQRHPDDKFSLHINDTFYECIKSSLTDSEYIDERITTAYILLQFNSKSEVLLELLLKREDFYDIFKISGWLLRNHPLIFEKHLDSIVSHLSRFGTTPPTVTLLSRYYTHLNIPQNISKLSHALLAPNCGPCVVDLLVCTSSPQQFLDYVPMELNTLDEEVYKLQQIILPKLRKIIPLSLTLESILHFCKGNYLKNIQRSLYSACYNVNENKLIPFIDELNRRAVSVRKHAIFLGFKVLNLSSVHTVFDNSFKTERNASITKSLFKGIFNMFLRNFDETSWILTQECLKITNVNDVEVIKILSKCKRVPAQHFTSYILFVWNFLENYPKPHRIIEESKRGVLDGVTPKLIPSLPQDFCTEVIKRYFLKSNTDFQRTINKFTSLCVIHSNATFLKLAFDEIKECVQKYWKSLNSQEIRKSIFNFIKEFCSHFIQVSYDSVDILKNFMTLWNNLFQPHEAYNEFLYMQFTLMLVNSYNSSQMGIALVELCNTLSSQSCFVPQIFYNSYKLFRSYLVNCDESKSNNAENELIIFKAIASEDSTASLSFVAIGLPYYRLMTPKMKNLHDFILNKLMESTDPIVQIYLHNYLTNV